MTIPQSQDGAASSSIGEQLGLGRNWQPTVASWTWSMLSGGPESVIHVLRLELSIGSVGLAFTPSDLELFVARARSVLSGIHLPGSSS